MQTAINYFVHLEWNNLVKRIQAVIVRASLKISRFALHC